METKPGDLEGLADSSAKVLKREEEEAAESTTKPAVETPIEKPIETKTILDTKAEESKITTKSEPETKVVVDIKPETPKKSELEMKVVSDSKPETPEITTKLDTMKPEPETKAVADSKPEKSMVDGKQEEKKPLADTKQPAAVEAPVEVPDPDEDDLDDLDDMLDEFTPTQPSPSLPKPTTALPTAEEEFEEEDGMSDEDFAKQLQAGMAELLGDMGTSPEMQAQFESMLKELGGEAALMGGAIAEPSTSTAGPSQPTPKSPSKKKKKKKAKAPADSAAAGEESFQETIRKTMERLNVSGDQATAAATSADPSDDLMAEMLKAMSAGGEGGEEDFSKMLLGMMEQLTNKDILYEPMKELDDKFPAWLEKNDGKVPAVDLQRYKEQQTFVKEIVGRFEATGYSDENAADREYIVERMQKMQAAGSPPPDLVGDMSAAQEAFGTAPEEGCPQQ